MSSRVSGRSWWPSSSCCCCWSCSRLSSPCPPAGSPAEATTKFKRRNIVRSGLKLIQTGFVVTGLMLLAGAAQAADIKSRTIKFAFQNAKEHPQGLGAQKFAEILSEKSGGKIKVRTFPGGTLGGDIQTISAAQGGTIEMSVMNAGLLSGLAKEYTVVDFPFLF